MRLMHRVKSYAQLLEVINSLCTAYAQLMHSLCTAYAQAYAQADSVSGVPAQTQLLSAISKERMTRLN